jgi:carbamoyltransferase
VSVPLHILGIEYCLREAGIAPADLDCVAFYDKPILKFDRILSYTPCSRHPSVRIAHATRHDLKTVSDAAAGSA